MRLLQVILSFAVVLVASLMLGSSTLAADDNCVTCHRDFEDDDGPAHLTERDVHFLNNLSCADCHGGDPTLEDMDEVRESPGFRGVPDHLEVPEFCARCHSNAAYMRNHNPSLPTDQLQKYRTSVHGQRLFNRRDGKVANCVSCHSVHQIGDGSMPNSSTYPTNLPRTCGNCHSDPEHMAGYDIPITQLSDYEQSVHGQALLERNDLGAPACNDCHSNHGAAPPGIQSLAAVCGNCHAYEAELFLRSPHRNAYAERKFPMCETCHSNHKIVHPTDQMVSTSESGLCISCHQANDDTRAFAVADSMSSAITRLREVRREAGMLLDEAILKGMPTTDEEFLLKEVDQILIQSRSLVHAFEVGELVAKAEEGIDRADTIKANSAALIEDYYFRRKGLALATLFITIVAIGLYLKIRKLD